MIRDWSDTWEQPAESPPRYLCERCGGNGRSHPEYGSLHPTAVPDHADGRCGLCDGAGLLGMVADTSVVVG